MTDTVYLLQFGILLVLLGTGFFIGRLVETMHLRRLAQDEAELAHIMVADLRQLPTNWNAAQPVLVTGMAVIATDYFKVFAANLRNFVGGNVRGYEVLVDRARREAIVRMLREAQRTGSNVVWNVRIETSTVGGRSGGGVEAIAYGTALQVR